ncbi:adenylate/guanylate cyclase domain-containing protein [Parahaliea mediterranea]|uniref:Adenylate/guanylate cyclase domain-containing protein n=1 Tax=Parahaliea mediterranea TaxID=651086 RepID=A0A939INS9_9GAMM|nr:adenylate/guanylate cyclase domain-containing protein [Parahaliea mediterranea]MBN7798438.1 adenylate/guanylate cyclase domain-containing protein [Parahaliea mediterranea]
MGVIEGKDNLFQCMSQLMAAEVDPVSRQDHIWQRYGETVAVMVLDSSGFSRTSKSHGIVHFLSRLMQLRHLSRPVLEAHDCKRIHFEADNAFAVFRSATDAVAAALALRETVFDSGLMLTDNERFRISMGVGYGRLLYSETLEGYFGDEMNYASKLGEDIACGDEILLTRAAFDAAEPSLVGAFVADSIETSGVRLEFYRHCFGLKQ